MFTIVLFLGGFVIGGRPIDSFGNNPFTRSPAACGQADTRACDGFDQDKQAPAAAPLRECPADSSPVTTASGLRYCIPDKPIKD